jgi:hypothetical protein
LRDEISFITSNFKTAFILIDDFKVPALDCFRYDVYQEQTCSLEFVKDSFNPQHKYKVYYPNYSDKTSEHHPLVGWGLIAVDRESDIVIPDRIGGKIKGPIAV